MDDAALVASVTEALRTRVLPRANVEGACVGGIGGSAIENRLIAADLFEHD